MKAAKTPHPWLTESQEDAVVSQSVSWLGPSLLFQYQKEKRQTTVMSYPMYIRPFVHPTQTAITSYLHAPLVAIDPTCRPASNSTRSSPHLYRYEPPILCAPSLAFCSAAVLIQRPPCCCCGADCGLRIFRICSYTVYAT